MSKNLFSLDGDLTPPGEEDSEYDALNSETFGDLQDCADCDWEESHEKLACELEKVDIDEEDNGLGEKMALELLQDEAEDNSPEKQKPPTNHAGDSNAWRDKAGCARTLLNEPSKVNSSSSSFCDSPWWMGGNVTPPACSTPKPKKSDIPTLEEVEKSMRQAVTTNSPFNPNVKTPGIIIAEQEVVRDDLNNGQQFNNHQGAIPRVPRNRYMVGPQLPVILNQPTVQIFERQDLRMVRLPRPLHPHGPLPHNNGHLPPPHGYYGPQGHFYPQQGGHEQMNYPRMFPPQMPIPPGYNPYYHHEPVYYQPNPELEFRRGGPPPPVDEYAGLMSPQEKQWLCSIQMMQLNSNQPYQHDYYHFMYQQRQQGNSGRKIPNQASGKNNREAISVRSNSSHTPLQFENSLGKLQFGSVTAPRKIIDMELVENCETVNKQMLGDKKLKQTLLEIEKIYNEMLNIEDMESSKTVPESREKMEEKKIKFKTMVYGYYSEYQYTKLVSHMTIRKGRNCILRIFSLMDTEEISPMVCMILCHLMPIIRKDDPSLQELMMLFLPHIRTYLPTTSFPSIVLICDNYDIKFSLSNKFAVSVLAMMVIEAEKLVWSCEDPIFLERWRKILIRLASAAAKENIQIERPVIGVPREDLKHHVSLIKDLVATPKIDRLVEALSSQGSASEPRLVESLSSQGSASEPNQ